MHSACKPHLHLNTPAAAALRPALCCPSPSPLPFPSPLHLPEGPAAALDALHTQPGTFAARFPPLVWRCEAGLCDALTPVIVSPKCKAVAPSCGQVFSWEFYSGKVLLRYTPLTGGGAGSPGRGTRPLLGCSSGPGCPDSSMPHLEREVPKCFCFDSLKRCRNAEIVPVL